MLLIIFINGHKQEKLFLLELIQANILRQNGVAYVYNDDVIGGNEELAIEFIKNKKNQPTLIALKAQLEEKQKIIHDLEEQYKIYLEVNKKTLQKEKEKNEEKVSSTTIKEESIDSFQMKKEIE